MGAAMSLAEVTRPSAVKRPQPSAAALDRAEAGARGARAAAQFVLGFISREAPDNPPPPLARMLRGGRGGQVRLKLYLSFLWFQTDSTGSVPLGFPSQVWADLLGLKGSAGGRRVNEAQQWLERNQFITVQSR